MKDKKIKKTYIPFLPQIRVIGEEVETELMREIQKVAERYKLPMQKLTASFELLPNPFFKRGYHGHYFHAKVTYDGEIREKRKGRGSL